MAKIANGSGTRETPASETGLWQDGWEHGPIGKAMSLDKDPELMLHLCGPLRLLRRGGIDVTPRVAKGQAILALLAASPWLRRPRAWLQDKLWSDLPQSRGSANLRQTLCRLREKVGGDRSWLVNGAGWVALDPTRVLVSTEPLSEDRNWAGETPEFCEGLDIVDPEFEDWIRNRRLAYSECPAIRQLPLAS